MSKKDEISTVKIKSADGKTVIWESNPGPQTYLMTCPIENIFYGGARGGGKSESLLAHFLYYASVYGKDYKGLLVRKTYPELEDIIDRARSLYEGNNLAEYKIQPKTFEFINGAKIRFRHYNSTEEADKLKGHEYTWIGVDEVGDYPDWELLIKLKATLRSSAKRKIAKFFLLTGNPLGVGHNWLKEKFVDPSPPLTPFKEIHEIENPFTGKTMKIEENKIFIPARIDDNKYLGDDYIAKVIESTTGDLNLQKAWLAGDWNVAAGGMFDDLYNPLEHVIPFDNLRLNDDHFKFFRSYDWGSSSPFSIGWWACPNYPIKVLGLDNVEKIIPAHSLIRLNEWFGCQGNNVNKGLMMSEEEIVKGIKERTTIWFPAVTFGTGIADRNIFDKSTGVQLTDFHKKHGIYWLPPKKGHGSRATGWQKIRQMLHAATLRPQESPGFYVTDKCHDWQKIVPKLPRWEKNRDDLHPDSNDHIADECRYAVEFLAFSRVVFKDIL